MAARWEDDEPGPYFSLIDAERAAAEQDGKPTDKIALIRRLREASGLGLREAKDAVEDYLSRVAVVAGGKTGWVDDFLDAERAAAEFEGRSVNKVMLIRAVRGATPGLDLRSANAVVNDYLRRRGANLPNGSGRAVAILLFLALLLAGGLSFLLIAA
ncbi:ribosomal protein L7/L12 [Tundrisphaera sp. TA3]|uniref:ribosomal protein L7/L12 n=1 Tax=Tundrisphaera sp. TA3 TaxID=3435775 RepID=UPI003EBDCA2D